MMNIMFNRNFNLLIYQNVSFSKKQKNEIPDSSKRILELQKEILRKKHTTKALKPFKNNKIIFQIISKFYLSKKIDCVFK